MPIRDCFLGMDFIWAVMGMVEMYRLDCSSHSDGQVMSSVETIRPL